MKKLIKLLSIAFFLGVLSMSCEGPAGSAGTDGIDGIDGIDGSDGTPGTAGNTVCLECHNTTTKTLIASDYNESVHAAGGAVGYAGSRNDCAKCHSNEGFIETQHTGHDTTATGFAIPTAIQCETCHDFHKTLDFENDGQDYALRTNTAVALLMDEGATTLDFGNNSNLCANCHQPRENTPVDDGTGFFEITSKRYGPHHGPQSTIVAGIKGYEISGTETYPSSDHAHKAGSCTQCHMTDKDHSMEPSLATCNECHSGLTDFDYNGVQTTVTAKLAALESALDAAGLLDASGYFVPGTYGIDTVGAMYNYKTVQEDRSMGVHNPPYILALLQNSIEAL